MVWSLSRGLGTFFCLILAAIESLCGSAALIISCCFAGNMSHSPSARADRDEITQSGNKRHDDLRPATAVSLILTRTYPNLQLPPRLHGGMGEVKTDNKSEPLGSQSRVI